MQGDRRVTIGCELRGTVADVHQLGGYVALPEPRETLIGEDFLDGRDGAFVCRAALEVSLGERIGQRVALELETDLDDIERCDDESEERGDATSAYELRETVVLGVARRRRGHTVLSTLPWLRLRLLGAASPRP